MLCRLKTRRKCEEIEAEKPSKRNKVKPRRCNRNFSHCSETTQKEGAVAPNAEEPSKTRAFTLQRRNTGLPVQGT